MPWPNRLCLALVAQFYASIAQSFLQEPRNPQTVRRRKFFSVKVAGGFSEGGGLCVFRFLG
jgi:hypothetical protein